MIVPWLSLPHLVDHFFKQKIGCKHRTKCLVKRGHGQRYQKIREVGRVDLEGIGRMDFVMLLGILDQQVVEAR